MSISKILNSLEQSWERDDILSNIKKGSGTDEIVNEFLAKNKSSSRKIVEKVMKKYFPNRLIRKS